MAVALLTVRDKPVPYSPSISGRENRAMAGFSNAVFRNLFSLKPGYTHEDIFPLAMFYVNTKNMKRSIRVNRKKSKRRGPERRGRKKTTGPGMLIGVRA